MRGLLRLAALIVLPVVSAAQAADLPERLIGTWHVLVYYKDANAPNPDEERWDDRVWIFTKKGDRLAWTEYPIAVFADESGRFERRGSGQLARVLGYWQPSEAQLAEIGAGLELNSRGMKEKTLRYTGGAWRSASRATAASASIVSYTEAWSIEGTPELPIFRREDSLGGERTESLDGVTLYASTKADPAENWFEGSFERDGSRKGTFRMRRAGAGKALTTKRNQSERQRDAFMDWMGRRKLDPDTMSQQDRADLNATIRMSIDQRMRSLGIDPAGRSAQIDKLVPEIEKRLFAENRTLGEIPALVKEAVVAP
jgi:hypothetical protein